MKIIVLPGLDGTASLRARFINAFVNDHSAQLISYPQSERLDYDGLAEYVLTSLPESEDYCIVAESFSGPVAIRIAERRNLNLKGIVFVASFAKNPVSAVSIFAPLLFALPINSRLLAGVAAKLLLGSWGSTELTQQIRTALTNTSAKLIQQRLSLVLQTDDVNKLATLHLPMLYLQAEKDKLVGSNAYQSMKHTNGAFSIKVLAGPHFLLGAKPTECAAAIVEFIEAF